MSTSPPFSIPVDDHFPSSENQISPNFCDYVDYPHFPTDEASLSLPSTIFFGLQGRNICRTSLEAASLSRHPLASEILNHILNSSTSMSCSLSKWPDHNVFIGTSKYPINIESPGYNHHSKGFRELGSLAMARDFTSYGDQFRVAPAIDSPERQKLVALHGLDCIETIYVVYIWMEVRFLRIPLIILC